MIYYFTGNSTEKKNELVDEFYQFLSTHRRNWRQKVFLIDEKIKDKIDVYSIIKFLNDNECDVVVNIESDLVNKLNYVNYIHITTEKKSVKTLFSNIITQLRVKNQI